MKVDINIHPNKIHILDVNVGDKLIKPNKKSKGTTIDAVTEITDKTVWFKNHGYSNSIIQELNDVEEIELTSNTFDVLKQNGLDGKEYFQIVFKHQRGIRDKEIPFSICYITDRGVLSDWTEHEIGSLPNPVRANFKRLDNKIIKLN